MTILQYSRFPKLSHLLCGHLCYFVCNLQTPIGQSIAVVIVSDEPYCDRNETVTHYGIRDWDISK